LSHRDAPVRKLVATDQTDDFDCGQDALDNQKAHSAETYACCQGDEVVGFYSLAVGSIDPESAGTRVMTGLARHPVPLMILALLADTPAMPSCSAGKRRNWVSS